MSYPIVSKFIQVSEQSAPKVQIPIVVGNELFVLTQQDVRRTKDIRYLSYAPMSLNQIFPLPNPCNVDASPAAAAAAVDVEMENAPDGLKRASMIADVSNQLKWSKQTKTTSPFPVRYSVGTSTTELQRSRGGKTSKEKISCGCNTEPKPKTASQECNTDPKAATATQACNTKRRTSIIITDSSSCEEASSSSDEQPCPSTTKKQRCCPKCTKRSKKPKNVNCGTFSF